LWRLLRSPTPNSPTRRQRRRPHWPATITDRGTDRVANSICEALEDLASAAEDARQRLQGADHDLPDLVAAGVLLEVDKLAARLAKVAKALPQPAPLFDEDDQQQPAAEPEAKPKKRK
jgi:hypothetical protein